MPSHPERVRRNYGPEYQLTADEQRTLVELRALNRLMDLDPFDRRALNALEARITTHHV